MYSFHCISCSSSLAQSLRSCYETLVCTLFEDGCSLRSDRPSHWSTSGLNFLIAKVRFRSFSNVHASLILDLREAVWDQNHAIFWIVWNIVQFQYIILNFTKKNNNSFVDIWKLMIEFHRSQFLIFLVSDAEKHLKYVIKYFTSMFQIIFMNSTTSISRTSHRRGAYIFDS